MGMVWHLICVSEEGMGSGGALRCTERMVPQLGGSPTAPKKNILRGHSALTFWTSMALEWTSRRHGVAGTVAGPVLYS